MQRIRLHLLVWLVLAFTLLSYWLGSVQISEYTLKGYAWFVPLIVAILILIPNFKYISFPVIIWVPWIGLIIPSILLSDYQGAFQRSIMLICPVVIGAAVSSLYVDHDALNKFSKYLFYLSIGFIIVSVFKSGVLITGELPIYGDAAGMISVALISSYIAVRYVHGDTKMFLYWMLFQIIPFIQLTRMAILSSLATLPFTLAPLHLKKRILFILIIIIAGTVMFFDERVQQKMFHSGSGSFTDLAFDNPDFKTHGRAYMWEVMTEATKARPWFGYGANASQDLLERLTGGTILHPHNDYLRLRYDYGYIGLLIFLFCNIMQMFHALKIARISEGNTKLLFYTGASAFVPFALLMVTDNIILYAAFFGNLHFTILGMAYAAHNSSTQIFEFDNEYPHENIA